MIVIDTDVLAIYHLFLHDRRYDATRVFMTGTRSEERGTTIYNLLELAGILASAGRADAGKTLIEVYAGAADMKVLYPTLSPLSPEVFWSEYTAGIVDVMVRGLRYGDAKIVWVAEENEASTLVTWNTRHYEGRTHISVTTPEGYDIGESGKGK